MRPQLNVIVGSVRDGRVGLPIASWFMEAAHAHGAFEPVLADLKHQYMKDGVFEASDSHGAAAVTMLDEIARWAGALRGLRV